MGSSAAEAEAGVHGGAVQPQPAGGLAKLAYLMAPRPARPEPGVAASPGEAATPSRRETPPAEAAADQGAVDGDGVTALHGLDGKDQPEEPPQQELARLRARVQELERALSRQAPVVLGIKGDCCDGCGEQAIETNRVFAEHGKVYCAACWSSWDRCGWWRPSLRILTAPPVPRQPGAPPFFTAEDAFFLPAFCCAHDDMSLFNKLKDELPTGCDFSDWHGGRHLGCQFAGDAARHQAEDEPPALRATVAMLEAAFGIRASASRLNLYRDGKDYKPFHCDRGRAEDGTPQVTVGASFGGTRELTMVHIKSGVTATFPQRNGDVFSFTPELNMTFMHGVPRIGFGSPSETEGRGPRLSLILWGAKVSQDKEE